MYGEEAERGWWPDTDADGEGWAVVWINGPFGQVAWHIGMDMVPSWLEQRDPDYDGYSTDTKNARVAQRVYPGRHIKGL
jgi:hypothetical protein